MTEFDLEKLQDIKVPEAKLSAKQNTLQSALSEFDEQQKQKNSFNLSNYLPDWSGAQESFWNILNPRLAGAFSLLILIGLGSVIYLPEIAKQPKPEEIAKEQDPGSERISADKAEQKEKKPAPAKPRQVPQPLATPRIQELKKKTLPQGNSSGFENGNVRKFRGAPSNNRNRYTIPKNAPSGLKIERMRKSGRNMSIGNSSIGKAATKNISVRTFRNPLHKGKALHHCLQETDQCGQIVADRFCASKQMGKAKTFQIEQKTASETISIQDEKLFKSTGTSKPLTFKSITCHLPVKK